MQTVVTTLKLKGFRLLQDVAHLDLKPDAHALREAGAKPRDVLHASGEIARALTGLHMLGGIIEMDVTYDPRTGQIGKVTWIGE